MIRSDPESSNASFWGKKLIRYSRLQDFVDAKLEIGRSQT
jgi:hypothetical protein